MLHRRHLLALALASLASASIYPTQPVQATVWTAGQPQTISWVEDWRVPHLDQMGPVDISLWCAETYLTGLGGGVDPMRKNMVVVVPGGVVRTGCTYTLRFTTSKPADTVIFSADFAIESAGTGTSAGGMALATQSGNVNGTGAGSVGSSGFKTVFTTAGTSSWTTTTSATSAAGQVQTQSTTSLGSTPSGALSGVVPDQAQRGTNAGRRGVDVEKLKFRFVFVIWPVLMGIAMAL